jgi:hypothetical protein
VDLDPDTEPGYRIPDSKTKKWREKNLICGFAFFAAINIRKLKIILNFSIVGSIEKEIF